MKVNHNHMSLLLKNSMPVFFSLLPRMQRVLAVSSKLMVPSPSTRLPLNTPPFRLTLTSTSNTSRERGMLNSSRQSNLAMLVSNFCSPQNSSTFAGSLLLGFSRSCSERTSRRQRVQRLNSSVLSSRGSLSLEPMEAPEPAERTDLTSCSISLLLSLAISSMAFSISWVRKLEGSEMSSSSLSLSRLSLPPSAVISRSSFSISSLRSCEFSSTKICSKFLFSLSSQLRFLNLISSLRISMVLAVPSSGSGRSLRRSSSSSLILLWMLLRGSLLTERSGLSFLVSAFPRSISSWNSRMPSSIFSFRFIPEELLVSLSSSSVCSRRSSPLRLWQVARSSSNSRRLPWRRRKRARCWQVSGREGAYSTAAEQSFSASLLLRPSLRRARRRQALALCSQWKMARLRNLRLASSAPLRRQRQERARRRSARAAGELPRESWQRKRLQQPMQAQGSRAMARPHRLTAVSSSPACRWRAARLQAELQDSPWAVTSAWRVAMAWERRPCWAWRAASVRQVLPIQSNHYTRWSCTHQFSLSQQLWVRRSAGCCKRRASSSPCLKTWQQRWQTTDFLARSTSQPEVSMFCRSLSYLKCRCHGTNTSCSANFRFPTPSPSSPCSNAHTYTSPTPPTFKMRVSSLRARWRWASLEKWWMTAMEMKASKDCDRTGRSRLSAANSWYCSDFYCAVLRRPRERSVPTMCRELLTPRYLPLPQPTSQTREPGGRELRKASILGQGLQRVWEKWGAILSQTSQTCFFSRSVGREELTWPTLVRAFWWGLLGGSGSMVFLLQQGNLPAQRLPNNILIITTCNRTTASHLNPHLRLIFHLFHIHILQAYLLLL